MELEKFWFEHRPVMGRFDLDENMTSFVQVSQFQRQKKSGNRQKNRGYEGGEYCSTFQHQDSAGKT